MKIFLNHPYTNKYAYSSEKSIQNDQTDTKLIYLYINKQINIMSKYNAKKVTYDNLQFDSKFEATYYAFLKELVKQGKISSLQRQKSYVLLPRQTDSKGKFLYHPVEYKSDFEYDDINNTHHTVDTKGILTPDFRLKQKLFYYVFKRKIECVKLKDVKKDELFNHIDKKMKEYFKMNGV